MQQDSRDIVLPHQEDQSDTNSWHAEPIYCLIDSASIERLSLVESLTFMLDDSAQDQCERQKQSSGQNSPHYSITNEYAIYAEVIRKSPEGREFQISPGTVVIDEDGEVEDVAPPVPERLF